MKLSKEVVDLESDVELIDFNQEFNRITGEDPEFAKILEYYEDQAIKSAENYFGKLSLINRAGNESLLIRSERVINILHRLALNLHRIMSAQAEIDEVERECGMKTED